MILTLASGLYTERDPFGMFDKCISAMGPDDLTKDMVLILWGGADISPAIYNTKPNKYSGAGKEMSMRDLLEVSLAKRAIQLGIPIIGICRGAQLVCALDGGKLCQHLVGHKGGQHHIVDKRTGKVIQGVTSAHHQMMEPREGNIIVAVQPEPCGGVDEDNEPYAIHEVNEVVYFPQIKALGIQGHPEWCDLDSPFIHYCQDLIKEFIL